MPPISQAELDQFHSMMAAPSAQNTNTHGNFFTHLIPTAGGTLGGVGGGALLGGELGTAILPGIGTAAGGLLGALAGGFLGGAGGKAVENKVEGQGIGNGVLDQGLEQGVLSAGPLRLLKGATLGTKAAIDVAKDGGGLAEAINAIGDKAAKPILNTGKNLITQGQQAQGRVAGTSAGTFGKELVTPQDTAKSLQVLQDNGIKIGNANNTMRDINDKLTQYGKQIATHFDTNNTPLNPSQVKTLASDFMNSLNTTNPAVLKQAKIVADDLEKNVTDTKSLWKFRVNLDSRIPDAKLAAGDNVLSKELTAVKGMRQFIAGKLGDVPGAQGYHDLSEILPKVAKEANRLNNPGGGLIGRVAASGPVQKTEQLLGKLTEATGKAIDPAKPYGLPAVASRTVPIGLLQAGASGLQNPSMATTSSTTPTTMSSDNMGSLSQNGSDLSSQQSSSPYGQANLMYDISRDPKNADKYLTLYSSLDKIFNPSGSTGPKATAQQASLAGSALDSIQKISNMIQQDPGVVNRNATPGQGLPVIGGLIQHTAGTTDYHTEAANLAQAMLHLQTGAAFSNAEKQAVEANMPRLGDSPEAIQNKLNTLTGFLGRFQGGNNTASSPTDLVNAVLASGYGQ